MEFNNLYAHGMVRVAAATFEVIPGNPRENATRIVELAREAAAAHAAVVVFPQDCLTGTTVGDWGRNTSVANGAVSALDYIAGQTADFGLVTILGARLSGVSRAISIFDGSVVDDVDAPWGLRADNLPGLRILPVVGERISQVLTGEVLEPSTTLIAQLVAPTHTVGATRRLHRAARELSRDLRLAVVQSIGSHGESSTDGSHTAGGFIAADGMILAAEEHLGAGGLTLADVALPELAGGSRYTGPDYGEMTGYGDFEVNFDLTTEVPLLEPPAQRPLVPASPRRYRADLQEAFEIQSAALARRLQAVEDGNIILGLSGGLDSTLALLVAVSAKAQRGRALVETAAFDPTTSRESILTFTMPGFATTDHTRGNAEGLARAIGVGCELIDIRPTATEMLKTMGHPAGNGEPVYDITFENVQAGLRADYLFRLANQRGGFVLGTGDLSEAALGWSTYGVGDHMSHYGVNGGVPKSMMPDLIRVAVEELVERDLVADSSALREVVASILATEVTPELIPARADATGEVQRQTTEGTIGPYLLHDFFLYHTLRGAGPDLVAFLALGAFTRGAGAGTDSTNASRNVGVENGFEPSQGFSLDSLFAEPRYFERAEILHWLEVFYRRFLTQQFKRSASVDGPVIWEGMSLSPRAGFRFPSDLSPAAVLAQIENSRF
ncbi:MAG: NAD(+) synthase [Mobiluncus sp.]|uniref:NAD(+) synthase n=1 Tax=Mobiluncus sp. TaxID=47293 RepID=UPI002582E854|nr:NAD(+) synthase [Mobiluncus sp.]MCI6584072.1 NAD(+) synthase [Mobiluncus sp.]